MEFNDLDNPFKAQSKPSTSRFAPKSSRFQPKTKQPPVKLEPKPELEPALERMNVKEEDSHTISSVGDAKVDIDEDFLEKKGGTTVELKEEEEAGVPESSVAMEEDDVVVAEYDVYFNPPDPSSELYVLQYPLRPSWRPYDLEQRCTEVRFKQSTGEVEVDLSIDMNSDNFDVRANDQFKMNKQVLSSSCKLPQTTGYAIGVLSGKKLFVNPIQGVVQLRPSMEYLDSGGSLKRNNPNVTVKEGSSNDVRSGQSSKQPWVSLNYHSSTSELAKRYLKKMMTAQNNPLQFSMNPNDYLNSLCPKAAITKMQSSGPSRGSLLALPLEERIKTSLIEGPSVQRFAAITHLAPNDPVEDVLEELQKYAMLVQGLWVVKTRFRYPNSKGPELLARDYALLLFSKSPVFKDSELDILGSSKSTGKVVLREIAVERPYCKDWKFLEPTDVSFIKHYPDVVEQQQKLWQGHEQHLQRIIDARRAGARIGANSKTSGRPGSSMRLDEGGVRPNNFLSKETRDALPKVLRKIFQSHKVCSFQTILQGLRDMAVSMSALPKADARASAAVLAADAPQEELQSVICDIAVNIHGVYLLKSSPEHSEVDPLRRVVIELFLGKGPNAKLKKGEIIEAAKIRLQKEPTNSEFQKVITDFCVSKGGAWVLKSGDGVPKDLC
ncbi:uncharacterized protein LOC130827712 isoform X2 [Amaranthus tricolor]|uniref:uncharacterized protein LOC130827712 isoform X2 n=1 Tax=Amaranthus tricolor TaxID=29722 RepID=UPI00258F41E7|nr:uncharacterized protein LOC130827712 isoform X2 [Amaranthus tricolor]